MPIKIEKHFLRRLKFECLQYASQDSEGKRMSAKAQNKGHKYYKVTFLALGIIYSSVVGRPIQIKPSR